MVVYPQEGTPDKAASMKKTCDEKGWATISMANGWTTIFDDGVTVINESKHQGDQLL